GQRARRRVTASEILSLGVDSVSMHAAIEAFANSRVLTYDADPLTGAPTVEISHETLLTAWPRLAEWIDDGRQDIRRRAAFVVALREWQLSQRNPDYVLSGARLTEYSNWASTSALLLTDEEREYLTSSAHFDVELREREVTRAAQALALTRRA